SLGLGDAYYLSYPDAMFDLVMNYYMFDLFPEVAFPQVLNEFKRVLRPGGRLIMANMAKGLHWYNLVFELVYRIHPPLLGGCRGVYLIPYLESAGFIDLHREYMTQLTYPTEVISCVKPMTS
ncbi:MAG: class I SAM-dependent methyltransferase, partial [Desulfomonilia bacterium]